MNFDLGFHRCKIMHMSQFILVIFGLVLTMINITTYIIGNQDSWMPADSVSPAHGSRMRVGKCRDALGFSALFEGEITVIL